jgi:hypothetical protein
MIKKFFSYLRETLQSIFGLGGKNPSHADKSPSWENAHSKIGQGALQAMIRVGSKELAQMLPAFPDSIKPIEEPGLPGNLTPQEVFHQKQDREREPELGM